MIKSTEIRRASFFIFLLILFVCVFITNYEIKNTKLQEEQIQGGFLQLEYIEKKNSKQYLYAKNIVISQSYITDDYDIGDIVKVDGRVKNCLAMTKDNYGLYLKSKGYDYIIYADNIEKTAHKKTAGNLIYTIRKKIQTTIGYIYNEYNGIVKALIVADRQFISKDEFSLFSRAGISHLISISGFHILLVSGIFFFLLSFLPKKYNYIISLILTLFYVILTGAKPSSVRAYIFFITYIISIYCERRYDIFSTGFLLSSIYMSINPYVIYDYGFCLSFLSVFSIAMFYSRIFKYFKKIVKNECFHMILSMICITISSQILTIPYVYYNFKVISLVSIITNLISVPLISLSYPFMIASIVFSKVYFVKDVFVNIVNFIMKMFYISNEILTSIPFSYIEFENKNILIVVISYILIFISNHIYVKTTVFKNLIKEEDK